VETEHRHHKIQPRKGTNAHVKRLERAMNFQLVYHRYMNYRMARVLFTLFVLVCVWWCPPHNVLFCFSWTCIPYVASFSGLSIFHFPFYWYYLTFILYDFVLIKLWLIIFHVTACQLWTDGWHMWCWENTSWW
jgi:amino acid permease